MGCNGGEPFTGDWNHDFHAWIKEHSDAQHLTDTLIRLNDTLKKIDVHFPYHTVRSYEWLITESFRRIGREDLADSFKVAYHLALTYYRPDLKHE